MSGSASLRLFHPRDLDDVHSLVVRTIDESYPPFYTPLVIEFFKKYHQKERILHDADRGVIIVLEDNGRIQATGTIVETSIRRVFVYPGCQRRGYGKMIMSELETKAVERRLKYVELDASLFAKKFYLDLHYVIMKHGAYQLTPNDILGYYKMAKSFSRSQITPWNFDGRRFIFSDRIEVHGNMGTAVEFEFIQRGNLVYGGYRGEKSQFGEIIGVIDGNVIEFSSILEHSDGTTDHGRKTGILRYTSGGKIHIIDGSRETGTRVMQEV
jgi:GNAT superfamily N-acetyltransferase